MAGRQQVTRSFLRRHQAETTKSNGIDVAIAHVERIRVRNLSEISLYS
jgi:hypothetical protein